MQYYKNLVFKKVFYVRITLIIVLFFSASCNNNPLLVDVSDIKANVKIKRYDSLLFSSDLGNISFVLDKSKDKYPFFIGKDIYEPDKINSLIAYISDTEARMLYDKVNLEYNNISFLEKDFSNAFKHYLYYLPNEKQPDIYTYVSVIDYENRIILDSNVIVIALDLFLGDKALDIYDKYGIPRYQSDRLNKENIVYEVFQNIALNKFPFDKSAQKHLLNNMIYYGKIMYFLDAVFPGKPDNLKIGYNNSQIKWCERNEENMWAYFIENKLLYENDYKKISSFLNEGPFTRQFTNESPSRISWWLGWQIVKSYMKNNENVTLLDLMQDNDYEKILQKSKYEPRNKI